MNRKNQTSEDDSQFNGRTDIVLLVALLAFIVFLAVAVFIIVTDTRGLRIPNPNNMVEPMLGFFECL